MHTRILIRLLCLTLLATTYVGAVAAGEKDSRKEYVIEVLPVVPDDLSAVYAHSSVVARVRILDSTPLLLERTGALRPSLRTKYTATVVESFKGVPAGKTIEFYQTAGTFENDQIKIRVDHQAVLSPSREYIVFLTPYPYLQSFSLAGEENGAFDVSGRTVRPLGVASVARAYENIPIGRFKDELHAIERRAAN